MNKYKLAEIKGYASVFGDVDLNGDVVEPGAFTKTLVEKKPSDIKMLFQHVSETPIGIWTELREDAHGLYVRGQALMSLDRARDVYTLVKAGAVDGLSIGFRTIKSRKPKNTRRRSLLEIDLWEISIVTFPVALNARIHSVSLLEGKSDHPPPFNMPPPIDPISHLTHATCLNSDAGFFVSAVREAATIIRT